LKPFQEPLRINEIFIDQRIICLRAFIVHPPIKGSMDRSSGITIRSSRPRQTIAMMEKTRMLRTNAENWWVQLWT